MKSQTLLALDIGNTNTKCAVLKNLHVEHVVKCETKSAGKGSLKKKLSSMIRTFRPGDSIISSVVPAVTPSLRAYLKHAIGRDPLIVSPKLALGIRLHCKGSERLGSDRIANMVGAFSLYGGPIIVISFGTATTFDVVTKSGVYIGGAIAPGLTISAEALFERAAQLSPLPLSAPKKTIGETTDEQMLSGIIFGHVEMTEGIITRMKREMRTEATIVATGGNSVYVAKYTHSIRSVDPDLLFKGLWKIYERNRGEK